MGNEHFCVRVRLQNVVKEEWMVDWIEQKVIRHRQAMMGASMLLKTFLISAQVVQEPWYWTSSRSAFILLIQACIKKVTGGVNEKNSCTEDLRMYVAALDRFIGPEGYIETYKEVSRCQLTRQLDQSAEKLAVNFENNIRLHYLKHARLWAAMVTNARDRRQAIDISDVPKKEKKKQRRDLKRETDQVLRDLLWGSEESLDEYHPAINQARADGTVWPFDRKEFNFKMAANPLLFLQSSIRLMEAVEAALPENKLYNVIPLYKDHVPGFISLCKWGLLDSLKNMLTNKLKKTTNWTPKPLYDLWETFFDFSKSKPLARLMRRCLKRGSKVSFRGFMYTDGVSCDFLFQKSGSVNDGAYHDAMRNDAQKGAKLIPKKPQLQDDDVKKMWIGVDPGRKVLIHAATRSIVDGKITVFKYTPEMRRKDCRHEYYANIRQRWTADARSKLEQFKLKDTSSASMHLETFLHYVNLKLEYASEVSETYCDLKFRSLRFSQYQDSKRSESKMVHFFKKAFGVTHKNARIAWGAWSHGGRHLKNTPPIAGACLVRAFRRHQFDVTLVNEYKTSQSCSFCGRQYLFVFMICINFSLIFFYRCCQ